MRTKRSKRTTKRAMKTSGHKKPKVSGELSARYRPGLPPAHVGRAVKSCTCIQCAEHRRRDQEALRDHVLGMAHDDVFGSGPVRFGESATAALREALGAE